MQCAPGQAELDLGTGVTTGHHKSHGSQQHSSQGPFHMKHDHSVFFFTQPMWPTHTTVLYVITPCGGISIVRKERKNIFKRNRRQMQVEGSAGLAKIFGPNVDPFGSHSHLPSIALVPSGHMYQASHM